MLGIAVPFTSLSITCKNAGSKPFCWANPGCFDFPWPKFLLKGHILSTDRAALRASLVLLSTWACKNTSHIQVLIIYFFPTPPIKLKLGLQIGGRLLLATRLDQPDYLANQKYEAVNNVIWLYLLGSSGAPPGPWKLCILPGSQESSVHPLDMTAAPHPRFPV